jgi:hypothetical protein
VFHNFDQRPMSILRHVLRHVLDDIIFRQGRLEVHVRQHGHQRERNEVIDEMAAARKNDANANVGRRSVSWRSTIGHRDPIIGSMCCGATIASVLFLISDQRVRIRARVHATWHRTAGMQRGIGLRVIPVFHYIPRFLPSLPATCTFRQIVITRSMYKCNNEACHY